MSTISDIRNNVHAPFEYEDEKIRLLFSYFLHSAPLINSVCSHSNVTDDEKKTMWKKFIGTWEARNFPHKIYSENSKFPTEAVLAKFGLKDDCEIKRSTRALICFRKSNETEIETLLRHIRNAIAHASVYVLVKSNRKYILLEDQNVNGSKRAIILFTQTDLQNLKQATLKNKFKR